MTFSKVQGTQKHCFLQPPKGCTYWWLKETPYPPHPHRIPTLLANQFGSPKFELFKLKLRVQIVHWPISVHDEECCIFHPPDEGIQSSTWDQHLTWSDLTITLSPKKAHITKKEFKSTFILHGRLYRDLLLVTFNIIWLDDTMWCLS